jgi:hypothetical protein
MTSSENPPMKGKWMDLINESVHTVDDVILEILMQ